MWVAGKHNSVSYHIFFGCFVRCPGKSWNGVWLTVSVDSKCHNVWLGYTKLFLYFALITWAMAKKDPVNKYINKMKTKWIIPIFLISDSLWMDACTVNQLTGHNHIIGHTCLPAMFKVFLTDLPMCLWRSPYH